MVYLQRGDLSRLATRPEDECLNALLVNLRSSVKSAPLDCKGLLELNLFGPLVKSPRFAVGWGLGSARYEQQGEQGEQDRSPEAGPGLSQPEQKRRGVT